MPSLAEMLLADRAKGQSGLAPQQPSKLAQALGLGYPATQPPQDAPMPEQRPVYDFDMPRDPVDRYAREQEVWNNSRVSPEQVSENKGRNLRDLLSVIPGPGNVIAAEDATHSFGDAANYAQEGRYGRSALASALGVLSGVGAVTGLPTGRIAGNVARGAKDVAPAFPAWHGSPHDFDEFKLDKIGTGEGAQAYGHGLYFAENPAVAKQYRQDLSDEKIFHGPDELTEEFANAADLINRWGGDKEAARGALQTLLANPNLGDTTYIKRTMAALDQIDPAQLRVEKTGRLYKAEIDAEPHQLLDWDRPLSQQNPEIKSAIQKLADSNPNHLRKDEIQRWLNDSGDFMTGARAYDTLAGDFGGREALTSALRKAGIPGIRYLDQGSRDAASGTSNYVIFDDKLTKILSKE